MQTRFVLGGALIMAAIMVVSIVTYFQSQEAYFSVDDLLAGSGAYPSSAEASVETDPGLPIGRRLQLRGIVDDSTVRRPEMGLEMRFGLSGKDGTVPVVYEGIVPDTFDMADSVTVGGYVTDSGVFLAEDLFVQCPSKYEAVPPGEEAVEAMPNG